MANNLFGLTADDVMAHHFPMWCSLGEDSAPSEEVVTEKLAEAGAEVAGRLWQENINAAAITDTNSPAWLKCRQAVRTLCALSLLWAATGLDPEVAQAWRTWLTDFFTGLDEGGAGFLGGGASTFGDGLADGPSSHVSRYRLATDRRENMSSALPSLRKDDRL